MDKAYLPLYKYNLIRVGSKNDGGYLVEKNSYEASDFVIGLGIYDDWNFEVQFNKPFIGVDDNLSFNFLFIRFLKKILYMFLRFYRKKDFKIFIDYIGKLYFYVLNREKFIKKFISNDQGEGNISLKNVINRTDSNNIFFKIDIEGGEYFILNKILKLEDRIQGLVIEFHDCDQHNGEIKNFISKTGLTLVHVHSNNLGGVDKNSDPLVIELTFSKNPEILSKTTPSFPHKLDEKNKSNRDEIILTFK